MYMRLFNFIGVIFEAILKSGVNDAPLNKCTFLYVFTLTKLNFSIFLCSD